MPHLIITADDYGLHPAVNTAIEECLAAGTVRSTCVMTNMPDATGACDLRDRFPYASLGIHWTLTLGKPVLPPAEIGSLVNSDGEFLSIGEFRNRWMRGLIRRAEIQRELYAQYTRFSALAGSPDYWNTHQNIHVFPVLFQTVATIGQSLEIPAMRCYRRITIPVRISTTQHQLRHPLYWLKGLIIARWSEAVEAHGTRMPAGTLEMPGATDGKGELEQVVRRPKFSQLTRPVELVIHPATMADGAVFGRLTTSRIKEYQIFRESSLVDRLAQAGVIVRGFEVL